MILDNYLIHKSHVTKAWMTEFGDRLRLHFLHALLAQVHNYLAERQHPATALAYSADRARARLSP